MPLPLRFRYLEFCIFSTSAVTCFGTLHHADAMHGQVMREIKGAGGMGRGMGIRMQQRERGRASALVFLLERCSSLPLLSRHQALHFPLRLRGFPLLFFFLVRLIQLAEQQHSISCGAQLHRMLPPPSPIG